jgi:hypothetical protein
MSAHRDSQETTEDEIEQADAQAAPSLQDLHFTDLVSTGTALSWQVGRPPSSTVGRASNDVWALDMAQGIARPTTDCASNNNIIRTFKKRLCIRLRPFATLNLTFTLTHIFH